MERTRGTNTDTNGRREESGVQGPKHPERTTVTNEERSEESIGKN